MVGILRIPPGFLQEYVGECKELHNDMTTPINVHPLAEGHLTTPLSTSAATISMPIDTLARARSNPKQQQLPFGLLACFSFGSFIYFIN